MSKKYYSNKYSKIFTLNTLLETLNETQDNYNKLLIHTANGVYVGIFKNPVDYDNLDIKETDDLLTIYRKMYLKASDNFESNNKSNEIEKVSENSISIILEDVEVITSGRPIKLPFVEIFIDQIIGFSIGSILQPDQQ